MRRDYPHPKDGTLLQPNEIPIILRDGVELLRSGERNSSSLNHRLDLEAKAAVTRYHQSWTLLPGNERFILAKMTVDYRVTHGLYNSAFKSIIDISKGLDIDSVRVTDPINNSTLYHEISEGYDFIFVRWWFDPPLSSGDVATTVLEYIILRGVDNCQYDSQDGDRENNATVVLCQESFEAPWANYWSIPVSDIKYEFHLPPNTGNFPYKVVDDSLALLEPSPCCLSNAVVSQGDGETKGPFLSQSFTSDELEISVDNPKNLAFGWAIEVSDESVNFCRMACDNKDNGGTNSLFWLLLLIPVFALLLALFCVCRRRRQNRQGEVSDIVEMQNISKAVPMEKKQDSSSSNLSTKEELRQPPPAPSAPKLADNSSFVQEPVPKVSLCTICLANEINTVILPCAHRAVCISCAEGLSTCPICRATIQECVRTFDA